MFGMFEPLLGGARIVWPLIVWPRFSARADSLANNNRPYQYHPVFI